ncbi:1845_t:CDS:2, partial [Acaulospora colombiana]
MSETIDPNALRETFPLIFKKFPGLDLSIIFEALDESEFDEEAAIEALANGNENGNAVAASSNDTHVSKTEEVNAIPPSENGNEDMDIDNFQVSVRQESMDIDCEAPESRSSSRLKRKHETIPKPQVKPKVSSKPQKKNVRYYKFREDEAEENESFELIGEDPISRDKQEPEEDDRNTLPCRILEDFIIYDFNEKNRVISLEEVDGEGRELHASGIVKPIYVGADDEEIEDDEENEGEERNSEQRLRTSTIFYFEIYYTQDGQSEIWLRTQYAFYKLLRASDDYVPYFMPIFKRIRAANLAIEAMVNDANITYDQFIEMIREPISSFSPSSYAPESLDVKFTERDIVENIDYITEEIQTWVSEQEAFGIFDCPLLAKFNEIRNKSANRRSKKRHVAVDTDAIKTKRNVMKNPNLSVLKHQNQTCVTPFINELTGGLFSRKFITVNHTQSEIAQDEKLKSMKSPTVFKPVTHKIEWNDEEIARNGKIVYYKSAIVDDELINVGDVVYVRNDVSDELWFAKVEYMFDDPVDGKMYHSRFFSHGKETVLEEMAGPREIFLLNNCTDNPLETIVGKANVKRLKSEEDESFAFEDDNYYFYRFWYDEEYATFEDVLSHENPDAQFMYCNENEKCQSCERQLSKKAEKIPKWISSDPKDGFVYKGVEYHTHDFVYMVPESREGPYDIGQIVEISSKGEYMAVDEYFKETNNDHVKPALVALVVRLLGRHDDIIKARTKKSINMSASHRDIITISGEVKDCRRLYFTDETKYLKRVDMLEGICVVNHRDNIDNLETYKDENDTFYVDCKVQKTSSRLADVTEIPMDAKEILVCQTCADRRRHKQRTMDEFMEFIKNNKEKLRSMDIFSGCGGLTVGMDKTGVVNTRWAIEFAPSAALTFERNHPDAITYNQCANILLKRAIEEHSNGKEPSVLNDFLGRKVPSMPAPGDVDFIYCGPPCQGFSRVNRYQKADDIKNTLIATALSYVDFYRPEYFLLENVRGMLSFRMGGEQDGIRIKGGIKMGVIKFILRALTSMGYQTRFGVQQAGHHGVPQSRRRLFIWGAKRNSYLPDFPQPSTCFPKQGSINILLPNGNSFTYNQRTNGHAPLSPVTVAEAINDLPAFEFVDPHEVYPATKEDKEESRPFKQIIVPERGWAGDNVTEYKSGPLSEYQRQLRKGTIALHNHITRAFNRLTIERIVRIPMYPELPEKLKPWCLSDPNSAASRNNGWKGLFGRLDFDGHFLTALTDINPMGKTG